MIDIQIRHQRAARPPAGVVIARTLHIVKRRVPIVAHRPGLEITAGFQVGAGGAGNKTHRLRTLGNKALAGVVPCAVLVIALFVQHLKLGDIAVKFGFHMADAAGNRHPIVGHIVKRKQQRTIVSGLALPCRCQIGFTVRRGRQFETEQLDILKARPPALSGAFGIHSIKRRLKFLAAIVHIQGCLFGIF